MYELIALEFDAPIIAGRMGEVFIDGIGNSVA